jgi:hypothetical protein
MAEGVDLDQPASVSWWPDGEMPEGGLDKSGFTTRPFDTLRKAINFVQIELNEIARRTARIDFASSPYRLDYSDPELSDKAKETGIDLNAVFEVYADEDGEITVKLPSQEWFAVFRLSANSRDLECTSKSAVEKTGGPMSLDEFRQRALTLALDKARKLGWLKS